MSLSEKDIRDIARQEAQVVAGGAYTIANQLNGGFENRAYADNASGLAGQSSTSQICAIVMKSKTSGLFAVSITGQITVSAVSASTLALQAATPATAGATITPVAATSVGIGGSATAGCFVNTSAATDITYTISAGALGAFVLQSQEVVGNALAASPTTWAFAFSGILGLPGTVAAAAPAANTATTGVTVGNFVVYSIKYTSSVGGTTVQLLNAQMSAYELPA